MNVILEKQKKKITLDDLADMMKRQFDFMEEKMATKAEVNEIVIRLDRRIEMMERRFEKLDEIVLQDHRPRIQAIEKKIGI